ncbi:ubiquitin carboxyl-terminal hydrolase 22 [Parasteatoda tepidariorum]|uniref:Ubiquitin carboxyl-terminal hydrolase n=1 Tax=Parasteatoda tepidariorum TaxID=114398 RepID=A0A2L2Y7P9_PARTP|nr:ubiquitin carboxyl-terminal hydrolase 22 [Parasteatoda tepidariorum]
MSKLCCTHIADYKKLKGIDVYSKIHANYITCIKQSARTQKIRECFCHICKTRSHRLHACLECSFVGCFDREHIQAHADLNKHSIAIDVTFGNVYCFSCKDYMYDIELNLSKRYSGLWQPGESDTTLINACESGRIVRSKFLGLRGLVNLGQTCYMNCIVQVLTHNPLLRNYFLSDKHNIYTCQFNCDRQTCLACEMSALFQEFYSGQQVPHIPYKLVYIIWKHAKHLDGYDPQDAHEFFITMLDVLHEHSKNPKEDDSSCQCIIHKIYTGRLQSDILCMHCKNVRTKIEEFRDIGLDLGTDDGSGKSSISLKDCLERYTQPEMLHSSCDSCQQYGLSKKQLTVQKLPVVISFHLKRLEFGKKITTYVKFPEYLNMTPFVSSIRGTSSRTNEESSFSNSPYNSSDNNFCLFAVVNHTGNKEGGHYISFIKMKQKWYKCDDDMITNATVNDVLVSEGYLLFYHKEVVDYNKKD